MWTHLYCERNLNAPRWIRTVVRLSVFLIWWINRNRSLAEKRARNIRFFFYHLKFENQLRLKGYLNDITLSFSSHECSIYHLFPLIFSLVVKICVLDHEFCFCMASTLSPYQPKIEISQISCRTLLTVMLRETIALFYFSTLPVLR